MNNINFKITNINNLFYQGFRMDIYDELMSLVDDITDMGGTFQRSSMTNIDLSDKNLSECTNFNYAFGQNSNLTEVKFPNQEINSAINMGNVFIQCTSLVNLDMSSFDFENVTNVNSMFSGCSALTDFKSFENLGKGFTQTSKNFYAYQLSFNSCDLTHESLMSIINNLYDLNLAYDVANGGTLYTQQLTLGSTNLAKLTSAEIAIATNKGWTVS